MTAELPEDPETEFWWIAAALSEDAYFMHGIDEAIEEEGGWSGDVGAVPDPPDDSDDDGAWCETMVVVEEERLVQLEEAFGHILHHDCLGGRQVVLQWAFGILKDLRVDLMSTEDDDWDPEDPTSWI